MEESQGFLQQISDIISEACLDLLLTYFTKASHSNSQKYILSRSLQSNTVDYKYTPPNTLNVYTIIFH